MDATTATTKSDLFGVVKAPMFVPGVSLIVRWDFEADTRNYWFTHTCVARPTGVRLCHASNCFSWKAGDAVGDAGLVVRYLREARMHLEPGA